MQTQVSDMEKQLLQVELKNVNNNLTRAKQRIKDLRGKLDTSENSRIEMKLELSRLERQIRRLNSHEAMKRHSLESATKEIELETLKRANGRLKRRVSQLEEVNSSWRWKPSTSFSLPRYTSPGYSSTDYDSGCWSSVSPANSTESLDNRSDFDDSASIISTSVSPPSTTEQLEQLKSELTEARQNEQCTRQQLEKTEEESRKKIHALTLDVQAADAEKQSILLKMEALDRHSKNLQEKVSSYQLLESEDAQIKQKLDELLKSCEDVTEERDSLLERQKDLQARLVLAEEQRSSAQLVSQEVQTEETSVPLSTDEKAQWKEVEKQMNRMKKENRRLRLKLKIKEEDEQAAREECALAKMRSSISPESYGEPDRPIVRRSRSVHEKNHNHLVRRQSIISTV